MGLTFVPTPLGNLRDITLRALDALREAELIVAEDTRVARRLLSAHGIAGAQIWTYHEHNAATSDGSDHDEGDSSFSQGKSLRRNSQDTSWVATPSSVSNWIRKATRSG